MNGHTSDVKIIGGKPHTVAQLFTARQYGVGYYQREYAWTEANVTELIADLSAAFLEDYHPDDEMPAVASYRPYFLGPIVTTTDGPTRLIVDGQQRLTTLTLLLIHLHHATKDVDGAPPLSSFIYQDLFGTKSFTIDVPERRGVMSQLLDGASVDPTDQSESVGTMWARYQDIVRLHPDDDLDAHALPYFCHWLLHRVIVVEIDTTDANLALEMFETMNDRGLRLSNIDMLKSFLLPRISSPQGIDAANELWRKRVTELRELYDDAASAFIKFWLRAKYAEKIRERRKNAKPEDFDIIGTAFHKWVRDNKQAIGLKKEGSDYARLINHDFERLSRRYMELERVSRHYEAGWEHVYFNSVTGFTLQYLPILAAVTPEDDDVIFKEKASLIAKYLDLFVARRMVNYRNYGYSTVVYTMFNLARKLRNKEIHEVQAVLAQEVRQLDVSFEGVKHLGLTGRNRRHLHYLLARMTAWVEEECGWGDQFPRYVNRTGDGDPFEVEHVWANKYHDRHTGEFENDYDFQRARNRFGGLLLLPRSFNRTYGAKTYAKKYKPYFGQNILVKSLNEQAYESNPAFAQLRNEADLPFRAVLPGAARVIDLLDERQPLYQRICERVWDPERLGLGSTTE